MYSKLNTFSKGAIDILPLMIPVTPFGIIFGAIGIELGFGPYITYATSIIFLAEQAKLYFSKISSGASSLVAITSSSVVSTRHLLYGAVMSQHLNQFINILENWIFLFITDQAFAVSSEYFKKKFG